MDWEDFHKRLNRAANLFEREQNEEYIQACLEERAALLSQEDRSFSTTDEVEVLRFRLAREIYAVERQMVREVRPLRHLTPVPCSPSFIAGITHVRGEFIAATDIRRFFDLPEQGLTDLNRLVILRNETMELGLLVDEVTSVDSLPLADINSTPSSWTGIRVEYLKGVTPEATLVLDVEKLLSDDRLVVNEQVAGPVGR